MHRFEFFFFLKYVTVFFNITQVVDQTSLTDIAIRLDGSFSFLFLTIKRRIINVNK